MTPIPRPRTPSFFPAITLLLTAAAWHWSAAHAAAEGDPTAEALSPDVWRAEKRIVDLHMHIEGKPERFERAVRIMDAAGVGLGIELGSGTVTHKPDEPSQFEKVKRIADKNFPGRFLHYMLLDYAGWDQPDWSERAVQQVIEGHRLGAAGLKEYKRLGLYLRDARGELIKIDDPKLDPVWQKCGELAMPVSIHVADPKAFWEPLDAANERWAELRDHPDWWFGDPAKYPPRMELLEARSRVIERHPETTFVCVHFGNNPEDIEWVDRELSRLPNMMVDVAARLPEIGRHPPDQVREVFQKHQDRILFGSDFMVYDRLILGSAGDDERPTDQDGYVFFQKTWRFFETDDRNWPHMTPIQGNWTISSINLPPAAVRKIYFDNARKLLARSWPLPTMVAHRIERDFDPDGRLNEDEWDAAHPVRLEYTLTDVTAVPHLSTSVRALWSNRYLYLGYEAPYTELTTAATPQVEERLGLWEDDVVEAFIAPDPDEPRRYTEYEWAPNGEQLDLTIDSAGKNADKDFEWSSGMESAVRVDRDAKIWRTEVRIPLSAISETAPEVGTRWRLNLYRHDNANNVFTAFSPTLTRSAHTPEKFGWFEFGE